MNRQARITALKLALAILEGSGEDSLSIDEQLELFDLQEEIGKSTDAEVGEEMNTLIGKIQSAIKVLEDPDDFMVGLDDVKLDA